MAARLDRIVRIGDIAVAAVTMGAVRAVPFGLTVFGSKTPVAVLIREGATTTAFDIEGARIPLDSFDRRFPGQRERFERAAAEAPEP